MMRMGVFFGCLVLGSVACTTGPELSQFVPLDRALDLDQAVIYPVKYGDTLSEIAEECSVPGGAETLAVWNEIEDVDVVGVETPLLLPHGTECERPLEPARLPRFREEWSTCSVDWEALEYDASKAFEGRSQEEIDALESSEAGQGEYDRMMAGLTHCVAAGHGLTVCWKPYASPGLEVVGADRVLFRSRYYTGYQGSGGDEPQMAWMDLDGDGDEEFILTQMQGWSNGLSMPGSSILIFEDEHTEPKRYGAVFNRPDHWLVNEQGGCDFLQVTTDRLVGPVLHEGNYFVAVRQAWTGEELKPVGPTFAAKRMLNRFFAEHRESLSGQVSAFTWLVDGQAEARSIDELED